MKTKIKDIATVRTGIFAKPKTKGDIIYLQSSYFGSDGLLKQYVHPDLPLDSNIRKHLLTPGEVLFSAKGSRNLAIVFLNEYHPSVASSSFLILSPDFAKVMPEYICWYLNTPEIQMQLKKEALGTSIQSISKAVLEELYIPIPSLVKQQKIIELHELSVKAKSLKTEISTLESKVIEHHIFNLINSIT